MVARSTGLLDACDNLLRLHAALQLALAAAPATVTATAAGQADAPATGGHHDGVNSISDRTRCAPATNAVSGGGAGGPATGAGSGGAGSECVGAERVVYRMSFDALDRACELHERVLHVLDQAADLQRPAVRLEGPAAAAAALTGAGVATAAAPGASSSTAPPDAGANTSGPAAATVAGGEEGRLAGDIATGGGKQRGSDRDGAWGLLVSSAKYGRILARRTLVQAREKQAGGGKAAAGLGDLAFWLPVLSNAVSHHAFSRFPEAYSQEFAHAVLRQEWCEGPSADELTPAQVRAAEAHAYVLRAACDFGLVVAFLPDSLRVTCMVAVVTGCMMRWAAAAMSLTPCAFADPAAAAPPLSGPQLLACQPHRLLAAACDMLRRTPRRRSGTGIKEERARYNLTRCVLVALAAAGTSKSLTPHVIAWLAPPLPSSAGPAATAAAAAAAAGAASTSTSNLRGCLWGTLRSALPAMTVLDRGVAPEQSVAARAHVACIVGMMRLAADVVATSAQPGSTAAGGLGSGKGGGLASKRGGAASTDAASALRAEKAFREFAFRIHCELGFGPMLMSDCDGNTGFGRSDCILPRECSEDVLSRWLPNSDVKLASLLNTSAVAGDDAAGKKVAVAEKVRQRRAQQQQQPQQQSAGGSTGQQQGAGELGPAAEAVLPPPLAVDPVATAFWQLRVCGNPGCEEFDCGSETALGLRLCGRCRSVRYCSAACQAAHWRAGHKDVCTCVAAAVATGLQSTV